MRSFWLVFLQSFRERVTSKAFIYTTLSLILITIVAISLPTLLSKVSDTKKEVVFISDSNAPIVTVEEMNASLTTWEWQEGNLNALEEYKREAEEGKLTGIYILKETSNNYAVEYYAKSINAELNSELALYLQMKKTKQLAEKVQLSAQDEQSLFVPIEMEKKLFADENEASVLVTYVMLMMILMAIMMYGTQIATAVASEKASRVMEVMVTKVRPLAMIFGKIFGIALASLTQFAAFFIAVGLYLKADIVEPAKYLGNFELNLDALTVGHFLYFFVYFLLGYFLYASIYAVFGSMVSRPEELNGSTMPVTILIMASAFSGIMFVLSNPTTTLAKVLSIIPFSSPFNMIILIMKGSASGLDIILSIGILLITTFGIGYFAAKVYPKGILHFGENLKLRQLIARSR